MLSVSIEHVGDEIAFQIELSSTTPITAPSQGGASDEVSGFIDIDVDGNAATGVVGTVSTFRELVGLSELPLGVDLTIDLSYDEFVPGKIEAFSNSGDSFEVDVTFSAASVVFNLPISKLQEFGFQSEFDFAVLIGDGSGVTDAAPDEFGTFRLAIVPEPNSFWLLFIGVVCLVYVGGYLRIGRSLPNDRV